MLSLDTAAVLAELLEGHRVVRSSADGRTLYTVVERDDRPRQVGVWDVPVARSARQFALLVAGWTALIVACNWLVRRLTRRRNRPA